jgi:BirA family biotin operon repressor/biotin-[acetyl-CoA-carboxylase] ligase
MSDVPATRADDPSRDVARRLARTRFHRVAWFVEVDSTNRFLLDAARAEEPEGLVAVADSQTAGRGRLGRRWVAPPGASLLASVLVRPELPVDDLHLLTGAAAVTAADAVDALARVGARLKWPNDLVVGDRKLAGVLAESVRSRRGLAVVVGLGLNVCWPDVPAELAGIATACNLESDTPVDRADLLVAWLERFDRALHDLDGPRGRDTLRAAILARSATVGRRVRAELTDGSVEGVATGITTAGHLEVLADDGSPRTVVAGDVVHLRPIG